MKRTEIEKRENLLACLSVFICLLMMILFNLPNVIIGLCFWSGLRFNVPEWVAILTHITWYAKSAANPLVFGLMNRNFRDELFKYRVFKWVKRDSRSEVSTIGTFHLTMGS